MSEYEATNWRKVQVGVGKDGEPVHRDVYTDPHLWIRKGSSSGLAPRYARAAIDSGHDVTVIDALKVGMEYRAIWPSLNGLATSLESAQRALDDLTKERGRRFQILRKHATSHWDSLPPAVLLDDALRPITVVVDHFDALIFPEAGEADAKGELLDTITREVREARSAGIHFALSSKTPLDPDVVGQGLLSDLTGRMLACPSSTHDRAVKYYGNFFGLGADEEHPTPTAATPGAALVGVYGEEPTRVQMAAPSPTAR